MVYQDKVRIITEGRGTYDITDCLQKARQASAIRTGLCNLFIHHTSASLVLCENADADVRRDLETWLQKQVVDGDRDFTHTTEGDDDMPAHIRSIITGCSLTLPVSDGRLALGTWQGVYLYEHRFASHSRTVTITIYGDQ